MATEKKFLDYTGLQAYDTAIKGYTASSENNGMMSSTDKDKLDDLMAPVELTQAEYDLLSSAEKNNGTIYFVKDAVTGSGFGTGSSAQLSELPTATSSFEGMVVQYIGTTGTYTHGYFYECVEDNGSYSWENINIQNNPTISVSTVGTASATTIRKQQITIGNTSYDITGTAYMEQNVTLSTSDVTIATFTNAAITTDSDIEVSVSDWSCVPENVSATTGTCAVTLPKVDTAATVRVRIYIR